MGRGSFNQRSGQDIPAGLPPVGPAGGDLGGTFPNPVVEQVQGQPVGAGTVDGQIWIFDLPTTSWVPSAGFVMPDNPSGAMVGTFAEGVTSVSFGQTQDLTAAGAAWSWRAQRGAAGFAGGTLTLGGGDGGTLGAQLAGDTLIQLGGAVAGATAKLSLQAGAAGEVGFLTKYLGGGLQIRSPASAIQITGDTSVGIEANGGGGSGIIVLNAQADIYLSGTSHIFRSAAPATGLTLVVSPTGVTSWTYVAGATAVTWGQTQDGSAAGAPWLFQAQKGFAGFIGGTLEIGGGYGGTLGTNLSGALRIQLGDSVSGNTAKMSFQHGAGGEFAFLQKTLIGGNAFSWLSSSPGWYIQSTTEVRMHGGAAAGDGVKLFESTNTTVVFHVNDTGIGFFAAAPTAQETVTGSRVANPALADLLTKLANKGLIVDGTII